ncbi:MAG: hypothetical protein LPK00_11525 [Bacillaceae bacterium]|uniref:hypothetical protein n=1 Tax=Halalkalibacter akibai TaxID=1411 RepID=UPI0011DD299C|nr:hypothetical protein [Halalkalibacter akibai]MDX5476153.1 hypothetical protein [Bacillaceae bacterium]
MKKSVMLSIGGLVLFGFVTACSDRDDEISTNEGEYIGSRLNKTSLQSKMRTITSICNKRH